MISLNERNIFIFDAAGALLSAILSLIILPNFSEILGLPTQYLYTLGTFPVVYGAYSLSCYLLIRKFKPLMLLGIISANLLYCFISASLILFYKEITGFGQILLLMEVLVVLSVVAIEFKVYKKALSK